MHFARLLLLGWLPASIYALTPATVAELAGFTKHRLRKHLRFSCALASTDAKVMVGREILYPFNLR